MTYVGNPVPAPAIPAIPADAFPASEYVAPPTFTDTEPAEHQPIRLEDEAHLPVPVTIGNDPAVEEPEAVPTELTDVGEATDSDD